MIHEREPSGMTGGVFLEREAADPGQLDAQSAQRAKGEIRRQIRANRGRYLWTFTYAEATYDYAQVVRDVQRFYRRLRGLVGRVWLLLVPEPHPGGHGWHLHGAAAIRLPHRKIKKAWGNGHVWVGDHKQQHQRWGPRHLSRYLAKYATKMVGGVGLHGCGARPRGAHRYWVTQGYEPERVTKTFSSLAHLKAWLYVHQGALGEWHQLELPASVPVDGWWVAWDDRYLASPPGG